MPTKYQLEELRDALIEYETEHQQYLNYIDPMITKESIT